MKPCIYWEIQKINILFDHYFFIFIFVKMSFTSSSKPKSLFPIQSYHILHLDNYIDAIENIEDEEEIIKMTIQTLFSLKHLSKFNDFTIETTDKTIHTIKFNKQFMEKLFDFINDEISIYIKENYNKDN